MKEGKHLDIAILLFDGITALDAVGPDEVLSRLPDARVRFVAAEPGPKRTDNGMLALVADHTLGEAPPLRSWSCRAAGARRL